jgi:hypothetical protein
MNLPTGVDKLNWVDTDQKRMVLPPLSGIPAPPARFWFGYHTSFALTSASAILCALVL